MKKNSISRKTFILLAVQFILLLSVLSSYILYSHKNYVQGIRQASDNYLKLYAKDLESKIESAEKVLEKIVYDNTDYSLIQSSKSEERYYASNRIKQVLTTSLGFDNYINCIAVGESEYGTFVMAENYGISYKTREEIRKFVLSSAEKKRVKSIWDIKYINDTNFVYKMFAWQGRAIGIFISADNFSEIQNSEVGADADTSIVIQAAESGLSFFKGKPENISENSIIYNTSVANGNLIVTGYTSHNLVSRQLFSMRFILLFIIMIATSYAFVMMHSIRRDVLKPLTVINDHIVNIQNGNYESRLNKKFRTKEFDSIQNSFNSMMDQIVNLKIRDYEKQLELNESELKTLKLQIRPHFFLNALTTISSLSSQHNDKGVRKYIERLSDNIRYMFRSGLHTVSLGEELSYVESYFEMQELKYPGCVFYFVDCDESLKEWQIPQMIIHTVIENEYKYAVSVDRMLSIIIKCKEIDIEGEPVLCIEIEDDGKGYPEDVLRDFEGQKNVLNDGSRVGLWSIKKMMELMYDRQNLFTISNISPHGCLNKFVIPKVPLNEVKGESHESIDC